MIGYRIDIYENEDVNPVITHICWGETEKDAFAIAQAHMGTDSFFRAAIEEKDFRGMKLSYEASWVEQ